jgi:hypothetical protein
MGKNTTSTTTPPLDLHRNNVNIRRFSLIITGSKQKDTKSGDGRTDRMYGDIHY